MSEPTDHTGTNPPCQYPKISSAPNWTSIFTLHPELEAPGYAETFIYATDNKRKSLREIHAEEIVKKKKKKKLGKWEKA
jgi:hypothetical protein